MSSLFSNSDCLWFPSFGEKWPTNAFAMNSTYEQLKKNIYVFCYKRNSRWWGCPNIILSSLFSFAPVGRKPPPVFNHRYGFYTPLLRFPFPLVLLFIFSPSCRNSGTGPNTLTRRRAGDTAECDDSKDLHPCTYTCTPLHIQLDPPLERWIDRYTYSFVFAPVGP